LVLSPWLNNTFVTNFDVKTSMDIVTSVMPLKIILEIKHIRTNECIISCAEAENG
jgi:hypothetical protein